MKRITAMKKQSRLVIMVATALVCAVVCAGQLSAAAAEKDALDVMSVEYLDPFDLTVTPVTYTQQQTGTFVTPATFAAQDAAPLVTSSPSQLQSETVLSSLYVQPLKIWIPYRPTFRSPCTPSW